MASISVGNMSIDHRKARPSAADLAAAARLKAIIDAIPRKDRPNQEALAEVLEVNQSSVSQFVNGKIPLHYRAVLGFAKALRIDSRRIRSDLPEQQLEPAQLSERKPAVKAQAWPFEFSQERFQALRPDQQQQISEIVFRLIETLDPPKSKGSTSRPKRRAG